MDMFGLFIALPRSLEGQGAERLYRGGSADGDIAQRSVPSDLRKGGPR